MTGDVVTPTWIERRAKEVLPATEKSRPDVAEPNCAEHRRTDKLPECTKSSDDTVLPNRPKAFADRPTPSPTELHGAGETPKWRKSK